MKLPFKLTRRRFLLGAGVGLPAAVLGEALALEPNWLRIRTVQLTKEKPTHRIVHFTDLHHKGDRKLLETVVSKVNALKPDFACFTGDLIEEAKHLPETLELLRGIQVPLYGVPGNHDYWASVDFKRIGEAFRATGGAWLMDATARTADGKCTLSGLTCQSGHRLVLSKRALPLPARNHGLGNLTAARSISKSITPSPPRRTGSRSPFPA